MTDKLSHGNDNYLFQSTRNIIFRNSVQNTLVPIPPSFCWAPFFFSMRLTYRLTVTDAYVADETIYAAFLLFASLYCASYHLIWIKVRWWVETTITPMNYYYIILVKKIIIQVIETSGSLIPKVLKNKKHFVTFKYKLYLIFNNLMASLITPPFISRSNCSSPPKLGALKIKMIWTMKSLHEATSPVDLK